MKKVTVVLSALLVIVCSSLLSGQDKNMAKGEQNSDGSYSVIDQTAKPPNGMESLYDYIQTNLKYPKQARKSGIEGRVFIEFVVDKSGQMINHTILKGIGAGCNEEALRVLKLYPEKWSPGKHEGKIVKQKIVLPISFKLGKDKEVKDKKS